MKGDFEIVVKDHFSLSTYIRNYVHIINWYMNVRVRAVVTTVYWSFHFLQAIDHESMESLKVQDTSPIDLYQCFKAFVRQDMLGDEECW